MHLFIPPSEWAAMGEEYAMVVRMVTGNSATYLVVCNGIGRWCGQVRIPHEEYGVPQGRRGDTPPVVPANHPHPGIA